jgi:hypothetical protein
MRPPRILLLEFPKMPRFKVGDRVERIGTLIPPYMKKGTIIMVIPSKSGLEWFTEYEVNFGNRIIAVFYETQLQLVSPAGDKSATT